MASIIRPSGTCIEYSLDLHRGERFYLPISESAESTESLATESLATESLAPAVAWHKEWLLLLCAETLATDDENLASSTSVSSHSTPPATTAVGHEQWNSTRSNDQHIIVVVVVHAPLRSGGHLAKLDTNQEQCENCELN